MIIEEHKPERISLKEWREIMQVPEVQQWFGVKDDATVEFFRSESYGVKFWFPTMIPPKYFGNVYVLLGYGFSTLVLTRGEGRKLKVVNHSERIKKSI